MKPENLSRCTLQTETERQTAQNCKNTASRSKQKPTGTPATRSGYNLPQTEHQVLQFVPILHFVMINDIFHITLLTVEIGV